VLQAPELFGEREGWCSFIPALAKKAEKLERDGMWLGALHPKEYLEGYWCGSSRHEALSSNPSTTKKKRSILVGLGMGSWGSLELKLGTRTLSSLRVQVPLALGWSPGIFVFQVLLSCHYPDDSES
jgi:hypothetical protein